MLGAFNNRIKRHVRFKWSFGHLDEGTRGDERTRRVEGMLFFIKALALNLNFSPVGTTGATL